MLLLWFLALLISNAFGEKFSGDVTLTKDNGFVFLAKFCFQYEDTMNISAGTLRISFEETATISSEFQIALYDDQDNSFYAIHDNPHLSCSQKIRNYARYLEYFTFENGKFDRTIEIHEHLRPRWWWAFLVNCDVSSSQSVPVSYNAHFTQNHVTKWNKEAGVNDRGLNTMYLVYLIVYVGLASVQLYAHHIYRSHQYIHQIIKLLTGTIISQLFAVLFHFVNWMIFTETGKHELFFRIIPVAFDIITMAIFLLMLLLLSQGWTVTNPAVIYPKTTLLTAVIIALFQCGFYIWHFIGLDPESTVYFYNSPPEWCFGALFAFVGIAYIILCARSWLTENTVNKKKFYVILGLFFSLWFFEPLLRIPIGDSFDAWTRDIAMDTIQLTWYTITFVVMMILLWPTWAHQYFILSVVDSQDRMLDFSRSSKVSETDKL